MLLPATYRKSRRFALAFCAFLFALTAGPLAGEHPAPPKDSALFREAEVLFSRGEIEKALWRFSKLTVDYPASPLVPEVRFRMALCYDRLKRPKDAVRVLEEILSSFPDPARMSQVLTLLGDSQIELNDRHASLHWYGKALLVPGRPQGELKNKIRNLIDVMGSGQELAQVESLYRGAYAGGYAKLKRALMARRQGDEATARRLLTETEKEYREMDYVSQLKELVEPSPPPTTSMYTIGVALPLSGIHQSFGERAIKGIELAIREAGPKGAPSTISLAVRDSKGGPQEAEKAIEELVTREKAIAVIGPLLSVEIERAARKAQQLKVPLLSLSQKEPALGKGDFVFQPSITPSAQVQALAAYSIKELDIHRFAVFYPNSAYGLLFKNLFAQEVTRRGGRILGTVLYQEDQTDFGQEIKSFFKVETVTRYDAANRKIEEFKSTHSIQGLFIPDTYDRAGLLLSQMAFYDVKDPVFLGPNGWNHPDLIRTAGGASEGCTFVDAFFKGNPGGQAGRFADAFRRSFGRDPETLDALAYEAARFVRQCLETKSVSSPIQLRDEIRQVLNYQGVSNLRGFGEGGRPLRTLTILRIKNGRIEQVSP
jgi:ABC-type branched-subunit amino acid transport system substrate-binding protein